MGGQTGQSSAHKMIPWGDMTIVTSSLMIVALLRDLSAEVIFLPRSASTMMAV